MWVVGVRVMKVERVGVVRVRRAISPTTMNLGVIETKT